jgi:hypothetical protein
VPALPLLGVTLEIEGMIGGGGAAVTVMDALPPILPWVAVIVDVPAPTPTLSPEVLLTTATVLGELLQTTEVVRS